MKIQVVEDLYNYRVETEDGLFAVSYDGETWTTALLVETEVGYESSEAAFSDHFEMALHAIKYWNCEVCDD